MNSSPAIAIHHHMLNIVPSKVKPLREFMKTTGKEIGEFSKSIRFLKTDALNGSQTKKTPSRALIFMQSALPGYQLTKLQNGKCSSVHKLYVHVYLVKFSKVYDSVQHLNRGFTILSISHHLYNKVSNYGSYLLNCSLIVMQYSSISYKVTSGCILNAS